MRIKAKSMGKGNVLLVERDPGTRASVNRVLTQAGYVVSACEDGYQAFLLSETLEQPLHLLIAEVRVGKDLSGVELARHLQVLRPGLRVLYLSTIPANPDLRRELQTVLDSYLSKPFEDGLLLAKAEALMEKSRLRTRGVGKGDVGGKGKGPEAGAAVGAWKSGPGDAGGTLGNIDDTGGRDWRPALPVP